MDEIDWLKIIKKALLFFTIICVVFAIFFVIVILMTSTENELEYKKRELSLALFLALLIGVGLPAIFGIGYLIMIIFFKILNSGRTVINFNKEHISDLPKYCSPAIASLIYDLKIDVYKDYTATILYLCIKKYLNLVKDGDTYKLELTKQQDYSNLGRCEKYVLDIIGNKTKFDRNQFKKEIIKDAQEKELITDKKHSKVTKIVLISIIVVICLFIAYNINKVVFIVLVSILVPITFMVYVIYVIAKLKNENKSTINIVNTEYRRTKNGKNIALLLSGLKKYIKEYTLIKEKGIDYIQILENYIPYALALDEADAIEEFIKYNEDYRDLIYGRKCETFL